MCCSLCEIFSAQEHLGITPPDGRRGCPAFRAARPTHVSFEAEMPQNVVAAQKVRARPPPPLARSPARPPSLREIFEATPDWASYKRGMRSPRTPRARASRLDRALTSPPRSNTQAIQAAKGYVHFRGSSLVRLPRPRFTGGLEQNPLARDARPRLVESTWLALRTRKRAERAFRQKKKLDARAALRLTAASLPPSPQDTVTSMIIPMGFAAAGITLLVKGIDDLSWGKNRKEGF